MERKEEIIYATLELASLNGLKSVSMSQIAKKVGIKAPSLYNHFSSKEEIINAMYSLLRSRALTNIPSFRYTRELDKISLEDMVRAMNSMNIPASVHWDPSDLLPPDFSLCVLDTLESILEYEDFRIGELRIESIPGGAAFVVHRSGGGRNKPAFQGMDDQFSLFSQDLSDGYKVTLSAGGGRHA